MNDPSCLWSHSRSCRHLETSVRALRQFLQSWLDKARQYVSNDRYLLSLLFSLSVTFEGQRKNDIFKYWPNKNDKTTSADLPFRSPWVRKVITLFIYSEMNKDPNQTQLECDILFASACPCPDAQFFLPSESIGCVSLARSTPRAGVVTCVLASRGQLATCGILHEGKRCCFY